MRSETNYLEDDQDFKFFLNWLILPNLRLCRGEFNQVGGCCMFTMRNFAVTLGLLVFAAGLAFANSNSGTNVSPDEALQKLMEGNKRYVENKMTNASVSDSAIRTSLAKSQKPYAIILTCS